MPEGAIGPQRPGGVEAALKGQRQKAGEGWGRGGIPEASDRKPRGGSPPPGEVSSR